MCKKSIFITLLLCAPLYSMDRLDCVDVIAERMDSVKIKLETTPVREEYVSEIETIDVVAYGYQPMPEEDTCQEPARDVRPPKKIRYRGSILNDSNKQRMTVDVMERIAVQYEQYEKEERWRVFIARLATK